MEHHVLPIFRYRPDEPGNDDGFQMTGTAFTFGEGTLVTCWHCVSAPLNEGESYGIAARPSIQDSYQICPIENLAQDDNGTDLALGTIEFQPGKVLDLAERAPDWGEQVSSFGYPLPRRATDPTTGLPRIELYSRFLRGYVTRVCRYEQPGFGEIPVVELDMLTPAGLSGGPLIRNPSHLPEVVGVVFGQCETYAINRWATIAEPGGKPQPQEVQVVTFGLAHYLDTLRAATGPATRNQPLADFLRSNPVESS